MLPQWKKNLYVLWFGTFIAGMSFSLVSPFMPTLLKQVGVGEGLKFWSGVAFSLSFLVSAIMAPIWGSLADRYGRKVMILRSGFGMAIVYVIMAFSTELWHILALRLINGLLSGFIPASTALVACNTPDDELGGSLGLLQTGSAVGNIMGPLIGGVMSYFLGIQQTLLLAGVVLITGTSVVVLGVKETTLPDPSLRTDLVADVRRATGNRMLVIMLFTVMLFQASVMILQPILPLYIEHFTGEGNASLATGIIFSLVGIATVLAAPRWGKWGEKVGFGKVLVIGLVGAGLLSLPHAFAGNLWVLGTLRFCFGLFLAALMPASNAIIARSVSLDFRGRAFGFSASTAQLGLFVGPLMGGFIGENWGMPVVFVITSAMLLLSALWVRSQSVDRSDRLGAGVAAD